MINKKVLFKELLLVLTTLIWGFAFVFQDLAMKYIEPFTFNMMRSFVGALFLILLYLVAIAVKKDAIKEEKEKYKRKDLIVGGLICGLCLFLASGSQQIGISFEGAGKSGFITALYILFVPLFGLFFKRKTSKIIVLCLIVASIGVYFINANSEGFSWTKGSWFLLACAIFYAMQIIAVDLFANKCDAILLTTMQFLVSGTLSMISMFIFESPNISNIIQAYIPILFVGILSSGVAFCIQTYAQRDVHPTVASLIMSLESVFALIGGLLILHESLNKFEILGCALIFIAIIVFQIPIKKKEKVM